jgi:hypothetical protein
VLTLAGLLGAAAGAEDDWALAAAVSDAALRPSVSTLHAQSRPPPPITEPRYARTTEAATAELLSHPELATERLARGPAQGRLSRPRRVGEGRPGLRG